MRFGPLSPNIQPLNPLKPLRVRAVTGRQHVLFDQAHPHATHADALAFTVDCIVQGSSPADGRARIQQLLELGHNAEWGRAGLYITFREDSVNDATDGWFVPEGVDVPELTLDQGWSNASVDVALRSRRRPGIGVFVDAKLQQNDANLAGLTMAAWPQGTTGLYPTASTTLAGADGSTISIIENPTQTLRAAFSDPIACMTTGRCAVFDNDLARVNSAEVFWKDHRFLNGQMTVTNQLLRVTLDPTQATPWLAEVWSGSAWVSMGGLALFTSDAVACPLKDFALITVSPDEVIWQQRHYNASGLFVVICRARRGSRLLELQVIAVSGLGTDAGGIRFASLPGNATIGTSADGTGVAATLSATSTVPGFGYLTKNPNAAGGGGTAVFTSGMAVAAGTIARIGVLLGYQDTQYTAIGATAALYAAKYAAYNRQRIRQRILIGA